MNGWVLAGLVLLSVVIVVIGYSCLVVGSWADEAMERAMARKGGKR